MITRHSRVLIIRVDILYLLQTSMNVQATHAKMVLHVLIMPMAIHVRVELHFQEQTVMLVRQFIISSSLLQCGSTTILL